jgi:hypothetical protein
MPIDLVYFDADDTLWQAPPIATANFKASTQPIQRAATVALAAIEAALRHY